MKHVKMNIDHHRCKRGVSIFEIECKSPS